MKISENANVGRSHDKVPNTPPLFGADGDEAELMRRSVGRRRGGAGGNAKIVCRGGKRIRILKCPARPRGNCTLLPMSKVAKPHVFRVFKIKRSSSVSRSFFSFACDFCDVLGLVRLPQESRELGAHARLFFSGAR